MNPDQKYHIALKSLVILLLACQFFANIVPDAVWCSDAEIELIEYEKSENGESEEEDNKKDKEQKIRHDFLNNNLLSNIDKSNNIILLDVFISEFREVSKPPPDQIMASF